ARREQLPPLRHAPCACRCAREAPSSPFRAAPEKALPDGFFPASWVLVVRRDEVRRVIQRSAASCVAEKGSYHQEPADTHHDTDTGSGRAVADSPKAALEHQPVKRPL